MEQQAYTAIVNRDDIPAMVTSGSKKVAYQISTLSKINATDLLRQYAILGYWQEPSGDPFPDFLIVNDDEIPDTYAWLSAYMDGFAPITQWCRIWPRTTFYEICRSAVDGGLGLSLGPWVGMIVAECAAQGISPTMLREMNGVAALSTVGFCAGRTVAVYNSQAKMDDSLERYESLFKRSRTTLRGFGVPTLYPIIKVLCGLSDGYRIYKLDEGLDAFARVLQEATNHNNISPELILEFSLFIARRLGLSDIARCASGTQSSRVDALDRVASSASAKHRTPLYDAILGFSASLVDPGAVAMPELLRRYTAQSPTAPIWAGAFAGAWSPTRVMSDFGGLGRIVAKELHKPSDIFTRPAADIGFDELSRWIGPSGNPSGSPLVRGLHGRTVSVELSPGVSVPIASGRNDTSRPDNNALNRQRALNLDNSTSTARTTQPVRVEPPTPTPQNDVAALEARVRALEEQVSELAKRYPKRVTSRVSGARPPTNK